MALSTPSRREFLSVLFKKRVALLTTFLALATLVTVGSYLLTPMYEADAKLLIGSGREFQTKPEAGDGQVLAPYLTKQEVMNSELEILSSTDLAAAAINSVGLAKVYPTIAANPPSNMRPIDAAIKKFAKDLKVQAPAMSEVITLAFRNADRGVAIQTLSTFIRLYQEKHASVFGSNHSSFFDQQIESYESKLRELTRKITDLRQSQSLFDVDAQRTQLIQDRAAIADALRMVHSRSVDAHSEIEYYHRRLSELAPLAVKGDGPNESLEIAKEKLLDLMTQLQALQQRFAEDVKPVRDLKEQIQLVQDFIHGKSVPNHKVWMERDPAYDDANLKLQNAQAEAASTDADLILQQKNLDDMDRRLRNLEEGSRTLESMERDHAMLDNLARTARSRFEDARESEELDKLNVVSISILEEPDASTKPASPKHSVFALVGCALGLLGAAALLFYSAVIQETIITAESVERLLGTKVLCVVPLNRVRSA